MGAPMRVLFLFVVVGFLVGCTTASRLNDVSIGMSKPDVVKVMGSPATTRAQSGSEFLTWKLFDRVGGPYEDYYVKLVGGKVESYGKLGDFDSTKDQVTKVEVQTSAK
jgi:hypothetical protein